MKKKLLTILIILVVGGVGILYFSRYRPSPEEEAVIKELTDEEVRADKVRISDEEVVIEYHQPVDFLEEDDDLYGVWGYIFSVAGKSNPDVKRFIVHCNFEDGEKVKITAAKEVVDSFVSWEISASEFLQQLEVEPLTKGPQI